MADAAPALGWTLVSLLLIGLVCLVSTNLISVGPGVYPSNKTLAGPTCGVFVLGSCEFMHAGALVDVRVYVELRAHTKLQLWRPLEAGSQTMRLVYERRLVPRKVHDVLELYLDSEEVYVQSGDRLALMKVNNTFPVPYVFNPRLATTMWYRDLGHCNNSSATYPALGDNVTFEEVGFPYLFSITASFRARIEPTEYEGDMDGETDGVSFIYQLPNGSLVNASSAARSNSSHGNTQGTTQTSGDLLVNISSISPAGKPSLPGESDAVTNLVNITSGYSAGTDFTQLNFTPDTTSESVISITNGYKTNGDPGDGVSPWFPEKTNISVTENKDDSVNKEGNAVSLKNKGKISQIKGVHLENSVHDKAAEGSRTHGQYVQNVHKATVIGGLFSKSTKTQEHSTTDSIILSTILKASTSKSIQRLTTEFVKVSESVTSDASEFTKVSESVTSDTSELLKPSTSTQSSQDVLTSESVSDVSDSHLMGDISSHSPPRELLHDSSHVPTSSVHLPTNTESDPSTFEKAEASNHQTNHMEVSPVYKTATAAYGASLDSTSEEPL